MLNISFASPKVFVSKLFPFVLPLYDNKRMRNPLRLDITRQSHLRRAQEVMTRSGRPRRIYSHGDTPIGATLEANAI